MKRFLSVAEGLRDRLSVILVQLPPNFTANPKRLEEFLEMVDRFALSSAVFQTRLPTTQETQPP